MSGNGCTRGEFGPGDCQAIVVTGASSGIGEYTAHQLAELGYDVACVSRRGTVPAMAVSKHGELMGFACDVTDEAALKQAIDEFATRHGGLVGLVNCAGLHQEVPSVDLTSEQLRRVFEVNVVAAFSACRLAYPHLKGQGGIIVNVGSFYDHLGVRSNLAYSASKAALASMTRTLAVEWARDKIAVLTVAPGYVLTDLNREFFADPGRREAVERRIPLGRLGTTEDVAVLIGALYRAAVPFLTGTTIYVDGGQGISL